MKEFERIDARYRTNRPAIESFVAAFGAYKARGEKIIARHLGVADLATADESKYSVRAYLAAMEELQDQFGVEFMRKLGERVSEKSVFPPGIDSVVKVMEVFNIAYYLNHPDVPTGALGTYQWKATSENGGVMESDSPYACAGDMGLIAGMARRFAPSSTVEHEPGSCRHEGGDRCRYLVSW
jgi:hypothetical protein